MTTPRNLARRIPPEPRPGRGARRGPPIVFILAVLHFATTTPAQAQPAQAQYAPGTPPSTGFTAATTAAIPPRTANILAHLLESVSYWSQKGKPEVAEHDLERMLLLSPNNTDTLAIAARLEFQISHYDKGAAYRDRLRVVAPDDPRLPALAAERALDEAGVKALNDARDLAGAGDKVEATKKYDDLFPGKIPDSIAIEYYTVLGTTSTEDFQEAEAKLALAAANWPGDPTFALALAKIESYLPASREAGVARLCDLSHVPSVATTAKLAWRETLLWLGSSAAARDQVAAYLLENAADPEITAKLKEIQEGLPDEGVLARMQAYEAGDAGHQDQAEAGFLQALAHDPDDAEAMVMLSIIRRQQKHLPESDKLIVRAIEIAPDRQEEFVADIGFDPQTLAASLRVGSGAQVPTKDYRAAGAAAYKRASAHVAQLAACGDYAGAEAALRRLMGKRPVSGDYVQLGYIQLKAGTLGAAEASFRAAQARNPRAPDATIGLAAVLDRQGRLDEARDLLAHIGGGSATAGARQAHAAALAELAKSQTDPPTRLATLQQAVEADPGFPWTRLDLARALYAQGRRPEAQQVMQAAIVSPHPSKDQIQAAFIYAQEHNDDARASQAIDLLPAKDRTPQMRAIQQTAALQAEIHVATRDRASAVARLLQVAAKPDPTGERATTVAKRLTAMGDKPQARQALRMALAATPSPTAEQRLAYLGPLMDADDTPAATALASQVDASSLNPSQRVALDGIRNGLAISRSDTLNGDGRRANAYETLAPRPARQPHAPDLNMALGRLYASDKKPKEALRINQDLLQANPDDLDVRHAAVYTALQSGDKATAKSLAAALASAAGDYRTQMMQADIARADGDMRATLQALNKARALRQNDISHPAGS